MQTPRVFHVPPDDCVLPHPQAGLKEGIVGIGGDLSPERLRLAYQFGLFPWFNEGEPIAWWSPDPRAVMAPSDIRIQKSMHPYFNQRKWELTMDRAFEQVVLSCKHVPREGQGGTWISEEIIDAYTRLHEEDGIAHSMEVWDGDTLVGGLYGIALGKVFCGESMFHRRSNASKYALIALAGYLEAEEYICIDCQQDTPHIRRMGAHTMSRKEFIDLMRTNVFNETAKGSWAQPFARWWDTAVYRFE